MEKLYACHYCNQKFKIDEINIHILSHKNNTNKPFICTYCNKSFSKPFDLKIHIRIHTGEKPYACKYCYKKVSDPSAFRRHMINYHPEKVNNLNKGEHIINTGYKCNYCNNYFSDKLIFDKHMIIHKKE